MVVGQQPHHHHQGEPCWNSIENWEVAHKPDAGECPSVPCQSSHCVLQQFNYCPQTGRPTTCLSQLWEATLPDAFIFWNKEQRVAAKVPPASPPPAPDWQQAHPHRGPPQL